MDSIRSRVRQIEKLILAQLAPRVPTPAKAHALLVRIVVLGDQEAAAELAAIAESGCRSVTGGRMVFEW